MIIILILAAIVSFVIACIEGEPKEFFEPALILLIISNIVFSNNLELDSKVAYIYYDSTLVESIKFSDIDDITHYLRRQISAALI